MEHDNSDDEIEMTEEESKINNPEVSKLNQPKEKKNKKKYELPSGHQKIIDDRNEAKLRGKNIMTDLKDKPIQTAKILEKMSDEEKEKYKKIKEDKKEEDKKEEEDNKNTQNINVEIEKNRNEQNYIIKGIMKKINEFTNKIIPDGRIIKKDISGDDLSPLKTPQIFLIITLLIITLIIIVCILLFNNNSFTFSSQSNMITKYFFYCLMFISVIIGLSILLLPTFKDLKTFIFQLKDLGFIIFYIIFLILFFNLLPTDILTNYAFLITPVSILIAIYLFYKGFL